MNNLYLLGKKRINFTNKESGQVISGYRVIFGSQMIEDDSLGLMAEEKYFSDEKALKIDLNSIPIPSLCEVEYGNISLTKNNGATIEKLKLVKELKL